MNPHIETFFKQLNSAFHNKELVRLLLSDKRNKESDLKNIIVSMVELKNGWRLNFVYRHQNKDITKNYELDQGVELLNEALRTSFFNADLSTTNYTLSLLCNAKGGTKLRSTGHAVARPGSFSHDKAKKRAIDPVGNIYLRELGIVNGNWELRAAMSDKYKQINRYIELLSPYLRDFPTSDTLKVVDMGSGKGYLTFALYDYLSRQLGFNLVMKGIEYRDDLVQLCNKVAQMSGFQNLTFEQGAIEHATFDRMDVLIALHACNTATDDAIFKGISNNASLIVCAPCCHKQLRQAMNPTEALGRMLAHGILMERQAEIVTDSLRAMMLEACGYKTSVFEFISSEHTPKNVMIVGKKTKGFKPDRERILRDMANLKQLFGIEYHHLEVLLADFLVVS